MGELYLHNLKNYIEKYNIETFVETGTGRGTGLKYALQFPFKKIYTIEIMDQLYTECVNRFKDNRITFINMDSLKGLSKILRELSPNISTLFWLDAHFPGADFHFNSYDYLIDQPHLHKPLKAEIELIREKRSNSKDVFIIDDLQIYERGPYELYNEEFCNKYGEKGIEFIENCYGDTHNFQRDFRHQGFLILTPKDIKC